MSRAEVGQRPRLAMFHSQYGWYQRAYLEALASAFDVRLVVAMDEREDDPMPPSLIDATHRRSLGMHGVRVRHFRVGDVLRALRVAWHVVADADVVLTSTQGPVHSKVGWLVSRLRRRPLCVVVEQWQDYPDEGVVKNTYNKLSKLVIRTAERCFVHGEYARQFALRSGVREDRIRIYPHLNADVGRGGSIPWPESNEFRFLYVGRFVPVKGLDILIPAFRKVVAANPSARLILCGDGPLREEIQASVRDLGEFVRFEGRVAPSELGEFMGNCHALVLPSKQSKREYEGWGLVVGEMASAGRPLIVSTAVGSAPELVHDGENGYVVQDSDVEALAGAMITLCSDFNRARSMGESSRRLYQEYSDPQRCVDLLMEVVGSR